MRYNVTLIWPPQYKFGYLGTDNCRILAGGIRDLGLRCDLTLNSLDPGAMNIVVGAHIGGRDTAEAVRAFGAPYIAVQTDWLDPSPDGQSIESDFLKSNFESACRPYFEGAAAVWDAYERNLDLLNNWGIPSERQGLLRLGRYTPWIVDIAHRPWAEKDIDVLFFGSLTPRRQVIIDEMAQHLNVVAVMDAPAAFRNDLIARAKINLNLHANERFSHLSVSRVGYLLNNQCVILSEVPETHPELQELMVCTGYDQLVAACHDLLASDRLEELAEGSFTLFQQMPLAETMRGLIEGLE